MFELFKKWFGKKEEVVEVEKASKSGETRLVPKKPSVKAKKKKEVNQGTYDPDKETIFPIDLNNKGMEALDCICLLAGFSFKNNKWHAGDVSIERTAVATVSDDSLDFINEHSMLTSVDYEGETVGERIYEFGESYQKCILDHHMREVEIGTLKTHRDKTYITMTSNETLLVTSSRICLLGPNMQIRYILDPVNVENNVLTAKVLGLHMRAPKSRKMYLVEL